MPSKILVIEDDRALRNAVVSALQSGGYEVEFAADGSAGVQALRAKAFDVVLLDIGLAFVDGWHVLSTLEGRRVPSVIVISARGDQADKFRALVEKYVQGRVLGVFGEPHVNVLALNMALDAGEAG